MFIEPIRIRIAIDFYCKVLLCAATDFFIKNGAKKIGCGLYRKLHSALQSSRRVLALRFAQERLAPEYKATAAAVRGSFLKPCTAARYHTDAVPAAAETKFQLVIAHNVQTKSYPPCNRPDEECRVPDGHDHHHIAIQVACVGLP